MSAREDFDALRKRVDVLLSLVPKNKDLPALPKRCILHWTGGGPKASALERQHYHFIFNQPDGEVVSGIHPVSANIPPLKEGQYAAHTGGFNSYSAGFAFAGMLNATPKNLGPYPLTEAQVKNGLLFVALCMKEWGLDPSNPAHLFTHAEAWRLHRVKGTANHTKWDIDVLEFLPNMTPDEVGDWLRAETLMYYKLL